MAQRTFLGVDLGAESGRVIGGSFDGSKIAIDELIRFPNGPVSIGDTLRWDVLRLWSGIQEGLAAGAAKYGDSIASVGVDTWGVDFVLFDKSMEMLGQPYHYRDERNNGLVEATTARVPRRDIFAATGLQFMQINSLYQLLAFQRDHPNLMEQADRFLMIPDFFHWCLCGSRVVEFTNVTTSQCYHAAEGDWAWDLLKRLELPTDIFPNVVPPGTKLGQLRPSVAGATGLGKIDVVTPATHDTGSAVVAVPTANTGQPNWAYISSGTWSLMGVEVNDAVLTPRALELNVTNEGGVDGTYRLLKNIMGLWLVQECKRSFDRAGKSYDYGELARLAEDAEPFRSIVVPDDPRFLKPDDMPTEIAKFCSDTGQPKPETEGQFVRCALESLALRYRQVLDGLEELTGVPVEVVHIVGGGCQNELLNQFTANACGRPVVAGPIEATVLGNLLVQARTAGEIGSLAEIREVVRNSYETKRFEPAAGDAWGAARERLTEFV